jgi:D-alanyl-D-alanine carboxypeptidase (penicillin-binding protein 5/6)
LTFLLSLFSRPVAAALALLFAGCTAAGAETIETSARQAILLDYRTGAVMLEKNSDELMAPSSMSKLMTAYLVFEKLKEGNWRMDDRLPVSESVWKRHVKSGGSLMFLPVGSSPKVSELIRGVIIQSGNDACSVLAEAHSGSEEAFAEFATRRARDLGMRNTTLKNASGWPDPEHLTTARDLSTLARRLIADFPEYFPIYSEREFVFNGIKQGNRNPLLYGVQGADGLKTGHTDIAGYGLVGTVKRGERRLIMVINGLKSMKDRAEESQRLIEWAFREFENFSLFKVGDVVSEAEVWLGEQATVPLVAAERLEVTMPRRARQNMKVTAVYTGPVAAPIRRGEVIGKLVITAPGVQTVELPLAAGADVAKLGFVGRLSTALRHILWGPKG